MNAVILIGLQGAGKTTLYHQRFVRTHLRISLDQLKTRTREIDALKEAIAQRADVVVDNTNPSVAERKRYLDLLRPAGYTISGYYFVPDIQVSLQRNALRTGKARIPAVGLFATRKRLVPPAWAEGFDALFNVHAEAGQVFRIEPWPSVGRVERAAVVAQ
jgi:hypothetical protein